MRSSIWAAALTLAACAGPEFELAPEPMQAPAVAFECRAADWEAAHYIVSGEQITTCGPDVHDLLAAHDWHTPVGCTVREHAWSEDECVLAHALDCAGGVRTRATWTQAAPEAELLTGELLYEAGGCVARYTIRREWQPEYRTFRETGVWP